VHENVIAGFGIGHVIEARLANDAAELHARHLQILLLKALDDLAGDGQTHAHAPDGIDN